MFRYLCTAVLAGLLIAGTVADTPANCLYSDIQGSWTFYEGERNLDNTATCDTVDPVREVKVTLSYPDVVTDQYGNVGTWTLIYNQGFDVTVNGRTYFAFSYYTSDNGTVTSWCDRTFPGWSHDVTVRHWACYYAVKDTPVARKVHVDPFSATSYRDLMQMKFTRDRQEQLVNEINSAQTMWKAKVYEQFEDKTFEELIQMSGGRRTWVPQRATAAPVTSSQKQRASYLPKQWDWRNVDGVNYVSPVRNQEQCGSCFAFSALAVLESRIRIQTNNTQQPVFSVQDVLGCSPLDQGCSGGFPYLTGGRYGKDYGLVEEACNPYQGVDSDCSTDTSCDRHYTAEYSYVGGYYGATNEVTLQEALVQRGPVAVAFMVYDDFRSYTSGIYRHIETRVDFDPKVPSSHAVLLVGYGVDAVSGEKYWIVKNSWGEDWGDAGYFKILRGVNECGIETEGVEATPIPL
ncbi:dipeptidyl peptidase 1-like [Schistocerca serialis cubense]|uniref:dipeptidyl peptidase 1-like n=1 Tax=Schistocerca serialis cubense TaxID=2023355 RepID=UPI00214EBE18|nr:dipeptidyl peptidase 1-like [Schistocerca serialis cubense]